MPCYLRYTIRSVNSGSGDRDCPDERNRGRTVDDVIVYKELVAITAGAGLLGIAAFLADLIRNKRIESEGWAAFFGITGLILLVTGLHTTVTWPFGGGGFEYANIAFGQPAAGFGALLLFAALYLWRHRAL